MKTSHFLMISATTFSLSREISNDNIFSAMAVPVSVINDFELDFAPTYTNFNVKDKVFSLIAIDEEDFEGDFDLYVPLKTKSFKVKAYIKSVSRFVPKPFFE